MKKQMEEQLVQIKKTRVDEESQGAKWQLQAEESAKESEQKIRFLQGILSSMERRMEETLSEQSNYIRQVEILQVREWETRAHCVHNLNCMVAMRC